MSWFTEAFDKGGIWMLLLLGVSVLAFGLIIERFYFLFFKHNINAHAFMAQIQKFVMANEIDRAIRLCNAAPTKALPHIVKAGLARADRSELEIQNAVEEAQLEVVPQIMRRTSMLPQIANVATLIGLLGTIFGLIQAFGSLSDPTVAGPNRDALLSELIVMAMNTTAFGLIVAIPCLLAYLFLSGMTKKIVDEIDQHSVRLENLLMSRGRGPLTSGGG